MSTEQGQEPAKKKRRSRRRYFKRKQRGEQGQSSDKGKKGGAAPSEKQDKEKYTRSKSKRNQRARRRRRERSKRGEQVSNSSTSIIDEIEKDYVKPESVFIYTYVSRPDQRDPYEFRAEHFGGTGRSLEDFDIDLSSLFVDDVIVMDRVDVGDKKTSDSEDEPGEEID